jgi:hypothetical protein
VAKRAILISLSAFALFPFPAVLRGGRFYSGSSTGSNRQQASALIFELFGHGLNHLIGFLGQLIGIDRVLNYKGRDQRSKFIGLLKDRGFTSLQAIRVSNELPGVTNLIEFLEGLVDLFLNVIRLLDSASF